ncbi:MAG: hypothetical protein WC159_12785, partial [Sphaerochaetaceae bacterium]
LCIQEDCKAAWSEIVSAGGGNQWTTSGNNIYNSNSGNVGINDIAPANKLSVVGDISSSGSLQVYGTDPAAMNYFASDLGIGGLPSGGGWQRYVDLSNASNATYLVRAGDLTSAVISTQSGRPTGTGFDFKYPDPQMVVGTLTKHPLNFVVGANTAMFLSDRGNVGIGTTNPSRRLEVTDSGFNQLSLYRNAYGGNFGSLLEFALNNAGGSRKVYADIYGGIKSGTVGAETGFLSFRTTNAGVTAEAMRIDNNGNVGIGTTNPGMNLDVYPSTGNSGIRIRSTDGNARLYTDAGAINKNSGVYYNVQGATKWFAGLKYGSTNNFTIYEADGSDTSRLTIIPGGNTYLAQNGGNVGIGTTDPGSRLDVRGGVNITGVSGFSEGIRLHAVGGLSSLWFNAIGNSGFDSGMFGITADSTGMRFRYGTGSSPSDLVKILNNGNVGIGTTSPTSLLDVNGLIKMRGAQITQPEDVINQGYLNSALSAFNSNTNLWKLSSNKIYASSTDWNIGIGTNDPGTARLAVMGGNVGIGTTTPVSKLDVVGSSGDTYITIQQNNGGGAGLRFLRNPTGYDNGFKNNAGIFYITTSPNNFTTENNRVAVDYNGNVGIGGDITAGTDFTGANMVIKSGNVGIGTTNPVNRLQVEGSVAGGDVVAKIKNSNITSGSNAILDLTAVSGSSTEYPVRFINTFGTTGAELTVKMADAVGGWQYKDRLKITQTGNVGIGTTSPTSLLDVNGLIKMRGAQISQPEDVINRGYLDSALSAFNSNTNLWKLSSNKIYASSTDWNIGIGTNDPGTAKLAVMGGNVGIGTTTPTEKLEVNGKIKFGNNTVSGENVTFDGTYSGNGMRLQNSNGYITLTPLNAGWAHIYTDRPNFIFNVPIYSYTGNFSAYSSFNLSLQTAGITRLTIATSTGNVGIGTTSPGARLDVNGLIKMRGAQITQPEDVINQGYLNSALSAFNSNTNLWKLSSNKIYASSTDWNIGIGTTDPGTAKLAVMGGNVGIGTTNPNSLLEIKKNTGAAINQLLRLTYSNTLGAGGSIDFYTSTGANWGRIESAADISNYGSLRFYTANNAVITEQLRIMGNGNVGIGTTSPGARLDVNGLIKMRGTQISQPEDVINKGYLNSALSA